LSAFKARLDQARRSTPFEVSNGMGITDELAKERNRAAAERTLMAWIRTCLSLISFGFGLDKIIAAIRSNASSEPAHAQLSVRLVAMSFVLSGILAMVAATVQHRRVLRRLRRHDYTYLEEPSIAQATAVLLTLIGLVTLGLLVAGALAS
jgi:putative membrane protein